MTNYNQHERAWCKQLMTDWQRIVNEQRLQLTPPGFSLLSSVNTFGKWISSTREILISKNLILNYSWDVVTEVLKHEIAHQFVSEKLGLSKGVLPPHGKDFQEACERVGVDPQFRGRSGQLPHFLRNDHASDRNNSVQNRIKKLFALAGSSYPHEAEAAMQKAQELLVRYNLEHILEAQDKCHDELQWKQIRIGNKQVPYWKKLIIMIVRDYFFVQTITITQYDAKSDSSYKAVELIGRAENIEIAAHVYSFLEERIMTFWKQYKKQTAAKGVDKKNFIIGMLQGFKKKLEQTDQYKNLEVLSDSRFHTTCALVLAQDSELSTFFKHRYPYIQSQKIRTSFTPNTNSYKAGIDQGSRLRIHKVVKEEREDNVKQLPES